MKKLSELGERKIIQLISKLVTKGNVAVGIGDDCAAVEIGENYLLVTTDMITQKTHIPQGMTPYQIGWFVVAINLSDIAAKGGRPLGLVLSLGLPKDTSEGFVKELIQGANKCATQYGTSIIGGDTKENYEMTLCGTAIGIVNKKEFMPRTGAKPGDLIAVTGVLGKAGAGYITLQKHLQDDEAVKELFEPIPRIFEGQALAQEKIVSSCMDISDGLSSSLYQLQELNHVGFEVEKEKIPVSAKLMKIQKQLKMDVYEYALHFGGDYELLVILSPDKWKRAVQAVKKRNSSLTVIGRVTKKLGVILVSKNHKHILKNKGYEHFKPVYF